MMGVEQISDQLIVIYREQVILGTAVSVPMQCWQSVNLSTAMNTLSLLSQSTTHVHPVCFNHLAES